MKKVFTLMVAAAIMFAGYAQNTPRYAASTRTWTFGNQTWSDAIRIPACDKSDSESSLSDPQCRSHTEGANTWFYYNWAYVEANQSTLCPSPWRVPTQSQIEALAGTTNIYSWIHEWDKAGFAYSGGMHEVGSIGSIWSSKSGYRSTAFFSYEDEWASAKYGRVDHGRQVRCVL
jgi:hypothetical protein